MYHYLHAIDTTRLVVSNDGWEMTETILLTEFGGIGFDISGEPGWGYTSVENEAEFLEDYARIIDTVYASKGLWGFCYAQLFDVEQKINGILMYERKPKCEMEKMKKINEGYHRGRVGY